MRARGRPARRAGFSDQRGSRCRNGLRVDQLAADDKLRSTSLEWVVRVLARPCAWRVRWNFSVRSLAAYPFAIPVPGSGTQHSSPSGSTTCRAWLLALESDTLVEQSIPLDGLRHVAQIAGLPQAAGIRPRARIRVPMDGTDQTRRRLLRRTFNSTAFAQLEHGNTGTPRRSYEPRGSRDGLEGARGHPAHAQDRWHAKSICCDRVAGVARVPLARVRRPGRLRGGGWASTLAMALAFRPSPPGSCSSSHASQLHRRVAAHASLEATPPRADSKVSHRCLPPWRRAVASLWAEALGPLVKAHPIAVTALILGAIEEER